MPLPQPAVPYQRYQSKSVWVTSGDASTDQTVSGSLQQLSRIQDVTYTIEYPLTDNIYLDSAVESFNPTPPGVNVNLQYWHTQGQNERFLGFVKSTPSGSYVMGLEDEKNLYVSMQDGFGVDAIGSPSSAQQTVIGLGNAVMTAYELGAQIGGFIEGRVTMNCLTANVYTGWSGVRVPSVDYANGGSATGRFTIPAALTQYNRSVLATGNNVAALGSQEMFVLFSQNSPFATVFTGQEACYLQSFNLGLSIDRQEQKPLGYVYPKARPIVYPIRVDLTTNAIVNRYQADQLERLACTTTGTAVQLIVKQPCTNLSLFSFYFANLQPTSQSFTQNIGSLDTVTTQWRGWLTNPNDLFIDPFFNYLIDTTTTGAWGESW